MEEMKGGDLGLVYRNLYV